MRTLEGWTRRQRVCPPEIGNRSGGNTGFGPAGTEEAIVFKLSPDGSREIYETTLGGSDRTEGTAIAADRTGAAYVVA